MRKSDKEINEYKWRRDESQRLGNKFYAAYCEAQIVEAIRQSSFSLHKNRDFRQHKSILLQMLEEILGFWDENYSWGIYYEIILSGKRTCLTGSEKEFERCIWHFEKSGIKEYVHGAYSLHMHVIVDLAHQSTQEAEMYADNLLKLLELRYGIESKPYAKMRLHILGEYFSVFNKKQFLYLFRDEYEYLERHAKEGDFFWLDALFFYAYRLWEDGSQEYGEWLDKCEAYAEQNKESQFYHLAKCKIGWLKAKILGKQAQNERALELLRDTIEQFLVTDYENRNLFYGHVYLEAAWNCQILEDYLQMYEYAQAGIEICEQFNAVGSELYYNLYNYIGIKFIQDGDLKTAANLYSGAIKDIVQKYGTDNETYVNYMNNLGVIRMREGEYADDYRLGSMNIKDSQLKRQSVPVICNEMMIAYSRGESIEKLERFYQRCMEAAKGEEYRKERERVETVYLSAKTNNQLFDQECLQLIKELEDCYQDNYCGGMNMIYWNSVAIYKWLKEERHQEALEIYKKIMESANQEEYAANIIIAMNYIQLLIINRQYLEAKGHCMTLLDLLKAQILKSGFGDVMLPLSHIRLLLSMFLHMVNDAGSDSLFDDGDRKRLLEEVIYCKTIEREIKSLFSQYKEEDAQEDLYGYCQAYRKLAALELRRWKQKNRTDDREMRRKYMLELKERESALSQNIPLDKMIHPFRFEDILIPENAICAEYFACWNFCSDCLMTSIPDDKFEKEFTYSYCIFVLKGSGEKTEILDMKTVFLEDFIEEEVCYLFNSSDENFNCQEEKAEEIIRHLHFLIAEQVLKYAGRQETVYLGTDFLLQSLPMDLFFYNENREYFNLIMADSVRYVSEDVRLNIGETDALIIGSPAYCINADCTQKTEDLPCSEPECRRIAEILGTRPYVGESAKQILLWENYQKNVIHLSTHGDCAAEEENALGDPLIRSYMKLAGYDDWKWNQKNKEYGNGIVTAADFLFMDLSKTDLVTLSACMSSWGMTRGLEALHGMRWAIGTAGARNSITALWEVDDHASAILMILLYRNLREMPIGKSLYQAKQRLRTISVEELKKDKELWEIAVDMDSEFSDKDKKPFEHWRYWAAFTCYCR